MSIIEHVKFVNDKVAVAALNFEDGQSYHLKFVRIRGKNTKVDVSLTDYDPLADFEKDHKNEDIKRVSLYGEVYAIDNLAKTLIREVKSNQMLNRIKQAIHEHKSISGTANARGYDVDEPMNIQDKNRLQEICSKIRSQWANNKETFDINNNALPDFDEPLPIPLPLFGFTINEKNKSYLTEGFWAMYDGKPELWVYISNTNEEGEIEFAIKPFFYTDEYNFKVDILPPSYAEQWLVKPPVFNNRYLGFPDSVPTDIIENLFGSIIPKHLWISNTGQRKALAYWIMATYFYDMFDAFPIGHGWGFYGSGKSRMGQLIEALAYHGQFAINMTSADLFRTKEEYKPTMIIDENEENKREVQTIQDDMINGSYVRGGGAVHRRQEVESANGKIYVRQKFELYSPTFFCSINAMRTPASRSRTITFPMVKKSVKVPICERRSYQDFTDIMYEFRFKKWKYVRDMYKKLHEDGIDPKIKDRDHELWLPIFTMMKVCNRWDQDFNDIMDFFKWNRNYKLDTDMTEEERPTLYASIAKLWYEVEHNNAGYNGRDNRDKDKAGGIWFRHPNNSPNMWEFKVENLTNIMKAIASEIGYKKDISSISVGKSLSMLGFGKGHTSGRKKGTFILDFKLFENIVQDHMDISIIELASREYDSKEILGKSHEEDDSNPWG